MKNSEVLRVLSEYEAYEGLQEWAENHGGLLQDLWRDCERGDWMLWLAAKAGVDRRTVVKAACACARTALVHVPAGEERPRRALELAEAWTRGQAKRAAVRAAARAGRATFAAGYVSAAAAFAAYAAVAALSAADDATAYADYAAVYAADAAALAAASAANDDVEIARAQARAEALADCAELVRVQIRAADIEAAKQESEV